MNTAHKSEAFRIAEAYLRMAEIAKYRPRAPGDGLGGIELSEKDLRDADILTKESVLYSKDFIAEENTCSFFIGISNYPSNQALVYIIEAARLLCSGFESARALTLLGMAVKDIRKAIKAGTLKTT